MDGASDSLESCRISDPRSRWGWRCRGRAHSAEPLCYEPIDRPETRTWDAMRVRPRSAAIDSLRLLGIVAVVAGHVWSNELARDLLYTWHVPLFFVLSGYLWARDRSMALEVPNRWGTIGLPYTAWLSLSPSHSLSSPRRTVGCVKLGRRSLCGFQAAVAV